MRMTDIINRYGVITILIFFLFVYAYVGKKMRDEAVDPLKKGGFYWGKGKYGKVAKAFIADIGALKQDDTIDYEDVDNYLNNVGKWDGNASGDTIHRARCK